MKKPIAVSHSMKKGTLDDDYTLYDSGEILHQYDKSSYPGRYNLTEKLLPDEIDTNIKKRLLDAASEENKDLVRKLLNL